MTEPSKLPAKRSVVSNQGAPPRLTPVVRNGRVLIAQRRRVLRPRRDAFIGQQLRKGPTDDVPEAPTFVLEGEEAVSIYHPTTNPAGVFDLISDTPAVWGRIDSGGGAA